MTQPRSPHSPFAGRLLLSISETADTLGVSTNTVYRILRQGDLPRHKIGSRTLIRTDALERFIEEQWAK